MFKKVDINDDSIRVMLERLDFLRSAERRSYESLREYVLDHEFKISCANANYVFAKELADAHKRYIDFLSTSQMIVRELHNRTEDFNSTNIAEDRNGKHYLEEWVDEG